MNQNVLYIKNRLSLRAPQEQALNILADICQLLPLSKENDLSSQVAEIRAKYPVFKDFERQFPNICFALATGVGKTRLMGAFIVYLYKTYRLNDFFILAPNLTIYNKLIDDFSKLSNPKYVFKGISDFATNYPLVITGDTYREMTEYQLAQASVRINIFNISKINADERNGDKPLIKRLSEYLGQSYFDYLASRERLVLLMDESHHYRAKRAMQVITELNPVLGLEVTATPQVQKGSKAVPFKNVVYEYSLARAIQDGFVKKPYVATRKNFNPKDYTPEAIDRMKVMDGIRVHQNTRLELEKFARNHNLPIVKPFVLIVTKDTEHAGKIKAMIQQEDFYSGHYKDKVLEIHSAQKGTEKEENIAQLLSLENPLNKIEIVIHVNMLKEGWDVTNLYTIVPLRASASETLTEQTIGRGLRLPYGRIMHDEAVDRLAIVAHDKFNALIEEANRPGSIIKKEHIIELSDEDLNAPQKEIIEGKTVLVSVPTKMAEQSAVPAWEPPTETAKSTVRLLQNTVLPEMGKEVKTLGELNSWEAQQIAKEKLKKHLEATSLYAADQIAEIDSHFSEIVDQYAKGIIPIPRLVVQPGRDGHLQFEDFELDTTNLTYTEPDQDILLKSLADGGVSLVQGQVSGQITEEKPENVLLGALCDVPEIAYDDYADLLYKWAHTAVEKMRTYMDEQKVRNTVIAYRKQIAEFIFAQMKQHSHYVQPDFAAAEVHPFEKIYPHNFEKVKQDKIYNYMDTIEPKNSIPSKVFTGFKKALHDIYKFDSDTEKTFAAILEQDITVNKWLRPADRQFDIYWNNGADKYVPDFVVETAQGLFLVELKRADQLPTTEVQEKAKAAQKWVQAVNAVLAKNNEKLWTYLLIPHTEVALNKDFAYFERFKN
ncbi:DEAD/DEAH box helicase [Candidatus Avelusimicrobium faecicola]|uniref:DEAD/DEAH box helicase n=1 Tax=Candidatus Avelusimicrobium faecicola TaxID=3416205 RepID=UPI003D1405A4